VTDEAAPLCVERIQLRGFRNYASAQSRFAPGLNVLWGRNGAGKTNLLEALVLLAIGRSPRTSRDAELVRYGHDGFLVGAELAEGGPAGRGRSLTAEYRRDGGKTVAVDGRTLPRVLDLCGNLLVVYFSPDDLWMVKGGPTGRRQLLDRLLSQSSPVYADALVRYRQALAQRNQTLRDVRARRSGRALLAIWEPQLIQYGAELLERRAAAATVLAPLAADGYRALAGADERLDIRYIAGLGARGPSPSAGTARDWAASLESALAAHADADIQSGVTGVGPHRDELALTLEGQPLREHGSQGQQRSAVLSLKFAERDYLARQTGRQPVLLVDDVLSELDEPRRTGLRDELRGEGQVFLTTADQRQAATMDAAAYWHVQDGGITAERPSG
jgi:DNA replication and repair protein RecF